MITEAVLPDITVKFTFKGSAELDVNRKLSHWFLTKDEIPGSDQSMSKILNRNTLAVTFKGLVKLGQLTYNDVPHGG